MVKGVLVIGGGIAGIQASLDLADSGVKVYLVEKGPSLGGRMAQLDKTFPTNDCSMCIISPKLVGATRHPNIELLTMSEVTDIQGEAGDFNVTVVKNPRYIDENKCVGCGECAIKCPSKTENEFDMGTGMRKAVYIPFPQAAPLKYTINRDNCLYFKMKAKGKEGVCMLCDKACEAEAVDFEQEAEKKELNVGAVVLATGYDLIDPKVRREYGYDQFQNVITSIELERYLSASGPTEGRIIRPSDGEAPERVAFVQCYGSRDDHYGCSYCSRVCCMYAIKEAILFKEHEPDVEDITVHFMDIRAYGKGFEEYYERAKAEGINFLRGRPGKLFEDPDTKDILIRTEDTLTGEIELHRTDLVVVASAIVPSEGTGALADMLDIETDESGFLKESLSTDPLNSSRDGIYICGCAQGPKDIPDTVAQASGAAAKAERWVKDERLPSLGKNVEELPVSGKPRIGVFVCHCGTNIAGVVDVKDVAEHAKDLPYVVYSDDFLYTCSDSTQREIQELIEVHDLNKVVITACSPRTHEPIFRQMLEDAGLNPYLFEMGNIRDQDSWVHKNEKEKATEKAKNLLGAAVAKAALLRPLEAEEVGVTDSALIIGGGISGLTAALDIAELGFDVNLIEKEPFLGGAIAERGRLAPSYVPASEVLAERYERLEELGVNIFTNTTLDDIGGFVGNFEVTARETPVGVSAEKCDLCGECERVCPVEVPLKGGGTRKAVWFKENGYPRRYVVDPEFCTECGECEKVCEPGAIDLEAIEARDRELEVGGIVLAIGSKLYTPEEGEFGYGEHPNVITNEELERLIVERERTGGDGIVLNGRELKKVAFIHCVGSRDPEGFTGCSRYCCGVTLKQANELKDLGIEVFDYYRDIRAFGKGAEKLYQTTRNKGTVFFRYTRDEKPRVIADESADTLKIRAEDKLTGDTVESSFDAVVLAAGMRPYEKDAKMLQNFLKVPLGGLGFFLEKHPKLAPVDTNTEGIYICGTAQYPKDVGDSVAQSSAAAARAVTILSKDTLLGEANVAVVDPDLCSGCEACIITCPYNAIDKEDGKAKVTAALCKGCGACAGVCRNAAITQKGFRDDQIVSMIDAALEEVA